MVTWEVPEHHTGWQRLTQAVRTTELRCLGFVCSLLPWRRGVCTTTVPRRVSFTSGLFQQADNSDTQLASDNACAHLQCQPIGSLHFLSWNRRRVFAAGYQLRPPRAVTHLLSFKSCFVFSHAKTPVSYLRADAAHRSSGPETDIRPVSQAMRASQMLGWAHYSWKLHCLC